MRPGEPTRPEHSSFQGWSQTLRNRTGQTVRNSQQRLLRSFAEGRPGRNPFLSQVLRDVRDTAANASGRPGRTTMDRGYLGSYRAPGMPLPMKTLNRPSSTRACRTPVSHRELDRRSLTVASRHDLKTTVRHSEQRQDTRPGIRIEYPGWPTIYLHRTSTSVVRTASRPTLAPRGGYIDDMPARENPSPVGGGCCHILPASRILVVTPVSHGNHPIFPPSLHRYHHHLRIGICQHGSSCGGQPP